MFTNTFNMDPALKDNFTNNTRIFKETLDRIIEKYINVGDGGIDVNIAKIQEKTLQRYMRLSRKNLKSQLDSTCEDDAVDETSGSNSLLDAVERDESSVEECGSRLFEFQPEDRDEGLQMSLSSHGSSLGELYPAMIRRMKKAWNGQQASVAASSVLRKYRRWRRQPKRSSLNSIFDVSLRHVSGSPKKMTSKGLLNSSYSSPGKKQLMRSKPTPGSALQTVISLYDGQVQQQSHGKEREQPYIRVMDLSAINKPEISLNDTFTVSTLPRPEAASLREQVPVFSGSPSRPYYAVAKASMDPSFKIREVSVPSHLAQTTMCPTYAPEVPAIKERPDVYCSPVRRSPFKTRMMPDHSPSPRALFKSCKDHVEHYSRESARPRSLSTSLSTTVSSSPERPVVQLRMLHSQDSHPSPKRELSSPYSAGAAVGHHKLRRHLSFDSAQPPKPISYLSEKVDEDFKKLYHKLMCENKSDYVNGPPCRLCAQSSEAGRGHSSSALAALALSPHRSVLRKRYRDWLWESHPRPKRFREEQYTHSPGSSRYMKQMLRPCLPGFPYESSNSSISGSPSKYRRHQPTMHQGALTSRYQPAPDYSGRGVSDECTTASGYSPSW